MSNLQEFLAAIRAIRSAGAETDAAAIRWLLQAEGLEHKRPEEICQRLGLSQNYAQLFGAAGSVTRDFTTINGGPNEHYVFYRGGSNAGGGSVPKGWDAV